MHGHAVVRAICVDPLLEAFYLFLASWNPSKVSGKSLNRIFINFLGVSFNMLIHQNVCIEGSGLFFWLALLLKNVIGEGPELKPVCPGTVWIV